MAWDGEVSTDQLYNAAFDILGSKGPSNDVIRLDSDTDGVYREDSWTNPTTGIGDASESPETYFGRSRMLQLQELADIYYGDDLAYRVVSMLPREAMKRKPKLVNPRATPDQIRQAEARFKRLEFYSKVKDGAIFGRLFGNSGLWLATENDQTQPFQRGEKVKFIKGMDRRILVAAGYYTDAREENLGRPSAYSVIPVGMTLSYESLANVVHETRIPMFHGLRLDPIQRAYNMGWDYSVLQRIYATIRDMGETWAGISILLRELSIKVLKIKGFQNMMSTQPDLMRFRLRQARMSLSVLRIMALDADTESLERVESGTLTGAAQVLEQVLLRVAAAAEMPVTRLYGRSPSGLSATGEADTRQWYDDVASYQENELAPTMTELAENILASDFPELEGSWGFEFPSLWQPTEKERTEAAKAVADLDAVYITNSVFSAEQIAVLRGGKNGTMAPDYTGIDVSLQAALAALPPVRDPAPQEGEEDEGTDDPANGPPGAPGRTPGAPPAPPVPAKGSAKFRRPRYSKGEPPVPGIAA